MSKRLIRADEHGLYVLTGGYAFRPLEVQQRTFFLKDELYARIAQDGNGIPGDKGKPSAIRAGERVNATHIGGTTSAKVGDETWYSSQHDPQYIKYVIPSPWLKEEQD